MVPAPMMTMAPTNKTIVSTFLLMAGRAARRTAPNKKMQPTAMNTTTALTSDTASSTRDRPSATTPMQTMASNGEAERLDEPLIELRVHLIVARGTLGPRSQRPDADDCGQNDQTRDHDVLVRDEADQHDADTERADERQEVRAGRGSREWYGVGVRDLGLGFGIGVSEGDVQHREGACNHGQADQDRVRQVVAHATFPTEGQRPGDAVHPSLIGVGPEGTDERADHRCHRERGEETKGRGEHAGSQHGPYFAT